MSRSPVLGRLWRLQQFVQEMEGLVLLVFTTREEREVSYEQSDCHNGFDQPGWASS